MVTAEDFRKAYGKPDQRFIEVVKQILYKLSMEDKKLVCITTRFGKKD